MNAFLACAIVLALFVVIALLCRSSYSKGKHEHQARNPNYGHHLGSKSHYLEGMQHDASIPAR